MIMHEDQERKKPRFSDDCEDIDDVCGQNKGNKQFEITANVGFFCGSCARMKEFRLQLLNLINAGDMAIDFAAQMYGFSVDDDTLCADGFGAVTVEEASISYRDIDGNVVGDITDLTGDASQKYYYIGLCIAFIILSFY